MWKWLGFEVMFQVFIQPRQCWDMAQSQINAKISAAGSILQLAYSHTY